MNEDALMQKIAVEPAGEAMPDVQHALVDLTKQTEYLAERVEILADRLAPVLRPAAPREAPEFSPHSTDLGRRIAAVYERLHGVTTTIDDLHGRIEV